MATENMLVSGAVVNSFVTDNPTDSNISTEKSVFNVQMDCIPRASEREDDLEVLGVEAYQIDELEAGIIKQVDKAIEQQLKSKSMLKETRVAKKRDLVPKEEGELSENEDEPETKLAKIGPVQQETEMERKIRIGEMTPFGNALGLTSDSPMPSIEKYLERQNQLQKIKTSKHIPKTQSLDLPSSSPKNRSPLKKRILKPRRKNKRSHLGTDASIDHEGVAPGKLPSEGAYMSSGSEYVPESGESDGEERVPPVPCRRKHKRNNDDENWKTDDEDWLDSEEDEPRRRKGGKELDDGVMDDYLRRVSAWEKENSREEMEGDCRELENGFRVPNIIWSQLYKYQKVGVQWLWELHQQRCGGILGDEMGLGKTVQVIAFFAGLSVSHLVSKHGNFRGLGPVLIVCPTTLMHQWVAEVHRWWPPFRAALLHMSGSFKGSKKSLIQDIVRHNGILISSYTGCVQQLEWISRYRWHYVVLDEGHKIRNPDSQVAVAVKRIQTPHRLILSGSPMQNNLRELWSLFDFIFPGKLGTLQVFMAEFAVPITQGGYANATQVQVATAYKCATVLRDTISPYLLRRMKSDVKTHINLPSKNEQVLFCKLTEEQKNLYREYLNSGDIENIMEGKYKVFVGLIKLRKICNHPDLYSGGPKIFKWDDPESLPPKERYGYWERAGKMVVVKTLLQLWKKQEHRVLIFTQSKQMLRILEAFVQQLGYEYLKLDGETNIGSRQPMINKFNADSKYFVFLATTQVGGLGVNLTGANRVIIYDPDWNPATDTQARERAWRIGQLNQVTIYRLVTAGTIEEKIYHRQIFKQFLTNKVLKDPRQRRFFKSNDLYELFTLKDDDGQGTETAALFAGTGSEIRARDLTHKDKVKRIKENISLASEPVQKAALSQEKIEAMKKLAQELSKSLVSGVISTKATPDHRRKRKKRKKGVLLEGEEVPLLVKNEVYKKNDVDYSKQDEYILKKLFSKTGIQTAMKHDKIMEEGPSDYALVEAEAEKVAKGAVKALKESRVLYQQQLPKTKPRFKGRSGGRPFNPGDGEQPMQVDELLSRIRDRNSLMPSTDTAPPLEEHSELLTDIRNFVAFGALMDNEAKTQELLEKFKDRLPAGKSPIFKALLNEICEFYRTSDGEGIWRLRTEYRW